MLMKGVSGTQGRPEKKTLKAVKVMALLFAQQRQRIGLLTHPLGFYI